MFTREVNTNVARNMKFLCDFCEFEASWKTTLRRHIQSKHEGIKYPCNLCEFRASHKSSI